MKRVQIYLSVLLVTGAMAYASIAIPASAPGPIVPKGVKPGVIGAIALTRSGTFCHLRFPAIRLKSLDSGKPELKSPTTGDIIDFYGPCDHDPLGKEEIESQKARREELRSED